MQKKGIRIKKQFSIDFAGGGGEESKTKTVL